jgi:hypothetical protein
MYDRSGASGTTIQPLDELLHFFGIITLTGRAKE